MQDLNSIMIDDKAKSIDNFSTSTKVSKTEDVIEAKMTVETASIML